VVEAAYAAASNRDDWAAAVTTAIAPLVPDRSMPPFVLWSSMTSSGRQDVEAIAGVGATPELLEMNRAMHATAPPAIVQSLWADHAGVATLSEALASIPPDPIWAEMMANLVGDPRIADSLALYFRGALGKIVTLIVPLAAPRALERIEHERLLRLVTHVSASERLLAQRAAPAEAILRPDGVVLHAEGDATTTSARDDLRDHVLRIERARREEEADDALELWRGMVDGRWSLVDEIDTDGKRLFVARENPRQLIAPHALTVREKQVLALVYEGKSNKLISYDLGFSKSVVSALVGSILEKLGMTHRAELIDIATSMGAFDDARALR